MLVALGTLPEVLEIQGIPDIGGIDMQPEIIRQFGGLREMHVRAIMVGQTFSARLGIVGKEVPEQLARLIVGQVARIAPDVDAAAGVVNGREQQILVRGDVPVPGRGQLQAAAAVGADAGKEEAGLAAHHPAGRTARAGTGWGRL